VPLPPDPPPSAPTARPAGDASLRPAPARPEATSHPRRPTRARLRGGPAARGALVVLAIAVGAACSSGPSDGPGAATITHVVDGDTVELRIGGQEETARLLGVDTPETVDPDEPVGCFGPEASARTKALLPPGTRVRITRDVEARDRYGRLLVYLVRAEDDLFVNEALLSGGYARVLAIAPNDAHRAELSRAAGQARAAGRGLWSACPPEGGA